MLFAALLLCTLSIDAARPKAKHVIFIGPDGVASEALRKSEVLDKMPNVKMMMEQGAYTLGKRSVMPSASAINWASIFNGLPTEQHGYNNWNSEKPVIPAVLDNGRGMPPTIYTLVREQRPDAETGCLFNWNCIAALIDTTCVNWHVYDPCYHDPAPYSFDAYVDKAVQYILEKKPVFFTFYIGETDLAGHKSGWESEGYYDSLAQADKAVGAILQAARDAGIFDDTIFVFSSDHGGSGKGHGKLEMAHLETPFILYGKHIRKGYVLEYPMMQYDLPATLAYALGLKIPKEWRGRPLTEMFK